MLNNINKPNKLNSIKHIFGLAALIAIFAALTLMTGCEDFPKPSPAGSADVSPSLSPSPAAPPAPSAAPASPAYINGLNGQPGDTDMNLKRPVAVMLNNISVAMPMCGISRADIIYEILAEGGITRMMGIYYDLSGAGNIGSMRSARPYYIDIAQSYDAIYVHAGGSDDAYSDISAKNIDDLDGVRGTYKTEVFYRDPSRMAYGTEHSLFTSGERLLTAINDLGCRTEHETSFDYGIKFTGEYSALYPFKGDSASNITVSFGQKNTILSYAENAVGYTMQQYGAPFIDGNTKSSQLFENVIVLYAEHKTLDEYGRLAVKLVGEGTGYCFRGGVAVEIKWSREKSGAVFKYTDTAGKELELIPGRTYIAIIQTGNKVEYK